MNHSKINVFLKKHGFAPEAFNADKLLEEFDRQMTAGLDGGQSSLAMLPAYTAIDHPVPTATPTIVLDAGGTNLRSAVVWFDAKGVPRIEDFHKFAMPGADGREVSAEAFFDTLANILVPVAERAEATQNQRKEKQAMTTENPIPREKTDAGSPRLRSDNGDAATARRAAPLRACKRIPAAIAAMALSASAAFAGIHYVTPEGAGARDGSDWANAFASIQAAIDQAGAGDEIRLKEGDYDLTAELDVASGKNFALRGGYAGTGDERTGRRSVVARAADAGDMRLLVATNATLVFEDIAFTNGHISAETLANPQGQAMRLEQCDTAMTNCAVSENGGPLAQGNYFGGVYLKGGSFAARDCEFRDNAMDSFFYSTAVYGAAVYANGCASLSFEGCSFLRNRARVMYLPNQGMAIWVQTSNLAISNCTFVGNYCRRAENYSHGDAFGGAIYATHAAGSTMSIRIDDSYFEGNWLNDTLAVGGTLYISPVAGNINAFPMKLSVSRCVFLNNGLRPADGSAGNSAATDCGDVYVRVSSKPGNCAFTNCAFIGTARKNAVNIGGGLVDFYRCTIGRTPEGFGLGMTAGSATMRNSIVWSNALGGVSLSSISAFSAAYSDLQDGEAGEGNFSEDPLLDGFGHLPSAAGCYAGGGFTGGVWSVAAETSPAIDRGDGAIGGEPQPNRHMANVGAYAGTEVASKSVLGSAPVVLPDELKIFAHGVTPGADSATIRGEVASTGGAADPDVFVVWDSADRGTASRGDWAHEAPVGTFAPWTPFDGTMTGIAGETVCRLVAVNAAGTAFSDPPITFRPATLPTLTPAAVTRVTRHGARVAATLVSTGGAATTIRLRHWPASDPAAATTNVWDYGFAQPEGAACVFDIAGLAPGTAYECAVDAVNAVGAATQPAAFTTLSTAPVVRYAAPAAAGRQDGSDWANAFTLQDAFDSCLYEGDVVYLKSGVYQTLLAPADEPSYLLAEGNVGLGVFGGYAGDGAPGGKAGETVLSRDTAATDVFSRRRRVLHAKNARIAFHDLAVARGFLPAGGAFGQGVYGENSNLSFSNCVFAANGGGNFPDANYYGMGLAAVGGSLALTNCLFEGNFYDSNIGSVYGCALYAKNTALSAAGTVFATNRVHTAYWYAHGGAIYQSGGSMELSRCLFATNRVSHNENYNAWRTVLGGAIFASGVAPMKVEDCSFFGNGSNQRNGAAAADYWGGCAYLEGAALDALFRRCVFSGNGRRESPTALDCGGVTLTGGRLRMENVLVADGPKNAFDMTGGEAALVNCTLAGYDWSGVLPGGGSLALTNSIVWTNGLAGVSNAAGAVSAAYTCSQELLEGAGNIAADPLFADDVHFHLKSHGGYLVDGYFEGLLWRRNPETSPCIDAGDPASDWSAETRQNGHRINLGAYGGTGAASRSDIGDATLLLLR